MQEIENPLLEEKMGKKEKGRNANAKLHQAPERLGEKKEELRKGC
jgi:hypothetical protein